MAVVEYILLSPCPDAEWRRSRVYVYLNLFPMPSADGYTLYSVAKRATAVGEDDFFVQRGPMHNADGHIYLYSCTTLLI